MRKEIENKLPKKEKTNTYSTEPNMAKCVLSSIIYQTKKISPNLFYKIYIHMLHKYQLE